MIAVTLAFAFVALLAVVCDMLTSAAALDAALEQREAERHAAVVRRALVRRD